MPPIRLPLAKVMTQANEHDFSRDQVRRGPGLSAHDLGQPARTPTARRARGARVARAVRAVRHPTGRPRDAGAPRGDDPWRTGRARKGAAALHDEGHSRARAAQPGDARAARDRQAPGGANSDGRGPEPRASVAQGQGSLAGQAAAGADPGRTSQAAGSGTDPREAQPVLTRWEPAEPAPAGHRPAGTLPAASLPAASLPAATAPATTGSAATGSAATGSAATGSAATGRSTFGSLRNRNYRLFATGQVISNTGSWMQRVAQDWL